MAGVDEEGILLFPTSQKACSTAPILPDIAYTCRRVKSDAAEKLGKRLARRIAVDAEQILSEAKLFLNPKPADIMVPLKGRRKRGHKSRSECVRRRLIQSQFRQKSV